VSITNVATNATNTTDMNIHKYSNNYSTCPWSCAFCCSTSKNSCNSGSAFSLSITENSNIVCKNQPKHVNRQNMMVKRLKYISDIFAVILSSSNQKKRYKALLTYQAQSAHPVYVCVIIINWITCYLNMWDIQLNVLAGHRCACYIHAWGHTFARSMILIFLSLRVCSP